MYRIVLTGGGTAGHVWPLLVVAQELRKRADCRFLYIGSKGIERDLAAGVVPFEPIPVGKLRRYVDVQNLFDPFRVVAGFLKARELLRRFKPDLVLAKGGYVSLPVVLAAKGLGIPILVHESDAVFGLANRIAAKHALFVMVGFPKKFYLPDRQAGHVPFAKKLIYTGIPVRSEFLRPTKSYLKEIGFDPQNKTLFVMGGSQGAHRINRLVSRIAGGLLEQFQILHISGVHDLEWLTRIRAQLPLYERKRYHVVSFLKREFPQALVACDLVLSRAGASTLAELAAASKPAILLPLASAASHHQFKNAEIFAHAGAAQMIDDHQVSVEELADTVKKLLSSEFRLGAMANKMSLLGKPDAASHIAQIILEILRKKR
ncbi:undecaprenyldiphospho-muramoylpentapeptide beta-N-acetylglucosaminyltransferase [Candidatus Berkelbacteria bacterium]|nr:undecaprenyldiphospho-muramoylpentapeptide beta-N-acetylglucosaminyltransferase [Candidatus Berkelbacteria bacterium]